MSNKNRSMWQSYTYLGWPFFICVNYGLQLDTSGTACGFITEWGKCSAKTCSYVITTKDDAACKHY